MGLLSVVLDFSQRPRIYPLPEVPASSKPIQDAAPVPPRLRVLPCPSPHFLHARVPTSSPCAPVAPPDPNPPCPCSPTHLCPWSTPRSCLHARVLQVSTFPPGTRSLRVHPCPSPRVPHVHVPTSLRVVRVRVPTSPRKAGGAAAVEAVPLFCPRQAAVTSTRGSR